MEANQKENEHEKTHLDKLAKEDPHVSWIYTPHTVTLLAVVGVVITYIAFTQDGGGLENNIKMGITGASAAFLLFATLQFRDTIFLRPHAAFWRFVQGFGVLYLLLLVFLLFQTVDDARYFLSRIDSRLGKPLPERSYAESCVIYTPDDPVSSFRHLRDTIWDEFIPAHFFGWFGKAILLRDNSLLWISGIIFEILEESLKHLLPNFAECWWDHIILDLLVCNAAGIYLGLKTVKYFQMKTYSWFSADVYNWEVLSSFKRFIGVVALVVVVNLIELNVFFMKFVLWIPPTQPMLTYRLILWWAIGIPGVREHYQFLIDPKWKKFGANAWLCVAIAGVELLICIKFGKGMFPNPHPPEVVWTWGIVLGLFALWTFWWFVIRKKPTPTSTSNTKNQKKEQ